MGVGFLHNWFFDNVAIDLKNPAIVRKCLADDVYSMCRQLSGVCPLWCEGHEYHARLCSGLVCPC